MAVSFDEKSIKLGLKGTCGSHVTHFWNFGTPLIYREQVELETSNLAQGWTTESTNDKIQN